MRQLIITKQITLREDESVHRYFQDINKYDLLSPEEEVELTFRIKAGDMKALERLVTSNLRFVISVAKQYQNKGLPFSDLINEGNIGLVKAAHKFDETRGFKFISYAVWWIRQSIIQAIAEQVRIVRLPLNKVASINKVAKAFPKLEQKYQREPSDEELAEEMEVTPEEISSTRIISRMQSSLDAPFINSDDDSNGLYDIIASVSLPAPDDNLLKESLQKEINLALVNLTAREAEVIRMFFGLNKTPPMTLYEIAVRFSISPERARQIREIGIRKLKRLLRNRRLL
jgi:RNA polymerase primary sigma factor